MRTYFIGTTHEKDTVVFHLVTNKDMLPSNLVNFFDERITTKKHQRTYSKALLDAYNQSYKTSFRKVKIQ